MIKAERLQPGDVIGICAPCWGLTREGIAGCIQGLETLGFRVKFAGNCFSDADGYAGTVEERAGDFNELVYDPDVKLVLHGGGEVGNEILPYVDYEHIRTHPKLFCSYSDGTSIVEAIYNRTGLVTFYGATLRTFSGINEYNRKAFLRRLTTLDTRYEKAGAWQVIHPGCAEGELSGGYLVNYAAMQGLPWFELDRSRRYLLFIEDHERFSSPAVVSKWFSNLEHRGVFDCAAGLIFGHYSLASQPQIDRILARLGERYHIPVVRCEDFGHGTYNAVFPIGIRARLDTDENCFELLEAGVI